MAPTELEKNKKKGQTLRSLMTKLLNKACEHLENKNIELLEEYVEQLIDKQSQLNDIDKLIESSIEDLDELDKEIIAVNEYRDNIISVKLKLTRAIRLKSQTEAKNVPSHSKETESREISDSLTRPTKSNVKLPKLEIEKYDGKIEKWLQFWSQFEPAIHENNSLTNIDKFNYLRNFVTSSALTAISGLIVSENNYGLAINILKERFGRKDVVISTHINNLLKLPPVKKSHHLSELRNLYEQSITQIRSLEAMGVELKSYANMLFPILAQLIPEDIILEFSRNRHDEKQWDVSDLLEYVRIEVETRERTYIFRKRADEYENRSTPKTGSREIREEKYEKNKIFPTAAALNTSSENVCIFCSSRDHNLENCPLCVVDRKQKLLRQGICFRCLKKSHIARFCKAKNICSNCSGRHSTFICERPNIQNPKKEEKINKNIESPASSVIMSTKNSDAVVSSISEKSKGNDILLQTAVARLENKEQNLPIRLLMDSASQRTFIDEGLSRKLDLKVLGQEYLTIYSFGSKTADRELRRRVKVNLISIYDSSERITLEALETPCITQARVKSPRKDILDIGKQMNLKIADASDGENENLKITLLIGSDYFWKIATGKIKRMTGGLVGMETKFGYVFNGSDTLAKTTQGDATVMKLVVRNEDSEETSLIKKMWELDSLGIVYGNKENSNLEHDDVLEEFEKSVKFMNARYQVNLPWNGNSENLGDNYNNAEIRFKKLVKKFRKNPVFFEKYKAIISKHIEAGIAEKVDIDIDKNCDMKYYMPHQAVLREEKLTTKMRIVFDASSSSPNSLSLNDCLNQGPNLNPDLLGLLLQFRMNSIAITGDIEGAFLQISLSPEDRNAVRFLWLKENSGMEPEIYRMTRVIFGATSSPFLLAATIKHHIRKYEFKYPLAYYVLKNCLYVDDLLSGTENEETAHELHKQIKSILEDAGFNMRKWRTNNKCLQKKWNADENSENLACGKVLGYPWNSKEDILTIDCEKLLKKDTLKLEITKRAVIRTAGRVFDPIGFISPYTIRAKILFQEIWQRKLDWDDPLPPDLLKDWQDWCEEINQLQSIRIPRHYFASESLENSTNFQFHCFVDASMKAYGAVLYLCYTDSDGKINSTFIASKTRVAPLHKVTLPRLELLAALIGARLWNYVQGNLKFPVSPTTHFWTDSMIAMHWIKGCSRKLKVFVRNRVEEIKTLTNPTWWNHCPGNENPADLLTRGENLNSLKDNDIWWNGPTWMNKKLEMWPNHNIEKIQIADSECEAQESINLIIECNSAKLFDLQNYSKLNKVLRITAWIQRFVHNLKNPLHKKSGLITAVDLEEAEQYWIKGTQKEHFSDEYRALTSSKPVPSSSKIITFNPILDERGIIRVGGRLQNAELPDEQKHPFLLPSGSNLSDLLIMSCHERVKHGGIEETLIQVREKAWILKGRQRIKHILFKCNLCQKFRTKPATQIVAPLPPDRIKETYPFHVTGVDYAGPLYVTDDKVTRKAYVLLFTCAVTRAIHLELTPDLTTQTFILAFRKFLARRGFCGTIYSDNAKTFKKAKS